MARAERTPGATVRAAREGSDSSYVADIQRARLISAFVAVVCDEGAANVTTSSVVERAGVSRRTFYEIFDDCEDCLLAALEDRLARASTRVRAAYEASSGSWQARIKAGLLALLALFDEQPQLARLLVVEWLAAGARALERRRELLERLIGVVEEGRGTRTAADDASAVPQLTAEGIVGGVASVLHGRLLDWKFDAGGTAAPRMVELVNPLMAMIVLPYLGPAAARRELAQPLPEASVEAEQLQHGPEDVLSGLNMRLTYRTMRVLAAIAANPGASNRLVARAAGVDDQGQISKLLMRLCKLGLAENTGLPVKGEPNAWSLTGRGTQVERLLRS
jgi:AcrR family transcriptional regulator